MKSVTKEGGERNREKLSSESRKRGKSVTGSSLCNPQPWPGREDAEDVWRQKNLTRKSGWESCKHEWHRFSLLETGSTGGRQEAASESHGSGKPFPCFLLEGRVWLFPCKRSWTSWRVRQPKIIIAKVQFINTRWQPLKNRNRLDTWNLQSTLYYDYGPIKPPLYTKT